MILFIFLIHSIIMANSNMVKIGEAKINYFHSNIFIDAKSNSCDLHAKEVISFSFPTPTNVIQHMVVSLKDSLYGFKVRKIETSGDNAEILATKIYANRNNGSFLSFKSTKKNHFHETWAITSELSRNVTKITVEYEYSIQRGIQIDVDNNKNSINLQLVNPYHYEITDYQLFLNILNFKNLDAINLDIPSDASINRLNEGQIQIGYKFPFPKESQLSIGLPLPLEVLACEPRFYSIVYFFVIAVTIILFFVAIITYNQISKD
jgi:hypothetical protein